LYVRLTSYRAGTPSAESSTSKKLAAERLQKRRKCPSLKIKLPPLISKPDSEFLSEIEEPFDGGPLLPPLSPNYLYGI
jgi:hypothetical protein